MLMVPCRMPGAVPYAPFSQQLHLALFDAVPEVRVEVLQRCLSAVEAQDGQEGSQWAHALFTLLCHGPSHFLDTPGLIGTLSTWLLHASVYTLPPVTVVAIVELAADVPGAWIFALTCTFWATKPAL
jgi:hypothetical protein